jgi:pyridoxal phosphate enzyme (YggS family)
MTATASVAERLAAVCANVARACERAGRDPAEVTIVGVSKTQPLEAVREALAAGLADFGENRAQELIPKAEAAAGAGLTGPEGGSPPRWHFIGHLQRNKARQVLPHIAALHSLDSLRLVEEIERRAELRAGEPLPCYLEVNVSGEHTKQGVAPDELPQLLATAGGASHIRVAGLMTVAPLVDDPERVRPLFRRLRDLAGAHGLEGLSMGMTDDYAVAIEEGATVLRIGRAIFGARTE